MAIVNTGLWLENISTHHAVDYRLLLQLLTSGRGGVWPGASAPGIVAETTGAELKVKVVGGQHFVIPRTAGTHQGSSHAYNDGDLVLDIDPGDTNPRVDLVVIRVRDSAIAGTPNDDDIVFEVIAGTPAPSPLPPVLPDDALALARIAVGASASFVANADITGLADAVAPSPTLVKYTSSGTFAKADYPGAKAVRVRVVGGGGAGGSAAGGSFHAAGAGGGGGGYAESILPAASLSASETVTVGAGATTSAGNGTASSFGVHVAAGGGEGGQNMGNFGSNTISQGGDGGVGSAGTILGAGSGGDSARVESGVVTSLASGGGSALGGGGAGVPNAAAGRAGVGYGGGGGGALATGAGQAGGNGADGVVIVEVHY